MKTQTTTFKNLTISVTVDPSLKVTSFRLMANTKIIRKVAPKYWRPFSAYHQSGLQKSDLSIAERETGNPNEYYYYLHYLLRSPNAPKTSRVSIRVNNTLYLFHDLLHAYHDVIGDCMNISRETEAHRLEQAVMINFEKGFDRVPDKILKQVSEMFRFNARREVPMDLVEVSKAYHG